MTWGCPLIVFTWVLEMKGRRELGAGGRCDCPHGGVKEGEAGRRKSNGEIASPPRSTFVGTCAFREEVFSTLRVRD